MSFPHCISSQLMSHLVTFRNLHGTEENWQHPDSIDPTLVPRNFHVKASIAKVGFGLLLITSIVEKIAISIFLVAGFVAGKIFRNSKEIQDYLFSLSDSASSTFDWTITYLFASHLSSYRSFYYDLPAYNLSTVEPISEYRDKLIHISFLENYSKFIIEKSKNYTPKFEELLKTASEKHIRASLRVLTNMLERPENFSLKLDLITEQSPTAIELLSFLITAICIANYHTIIEWITPEIGIDDMQRPSTTGQFPDFPPDQEYSLDFFNETTKIEIKKANESWISNEIGDFLKNYTGHLSLSRFEKFEIIKSTNSAKEKEIFSRVKAISGEAHRGSLFFNDILIIYLEINKTKT